MRRRASCAFRTALIHHESIKIFCKGYSWFFIVIIKPLLNLLSGLGNHPEIWKYHKGVVFAPQGAPGPVNWASYCKCCLLCIFGEQSSDVLSPRTYLAIS